jgi:DNA processing protein
LLYLLTGVDILSKIMMEEKYFFNAVAVHLLGSYSAIKKAKRGYDTWREAFEGLQRKGSNPCDPRIAWERLQKMDMDMDLILSSEQGYPKILHEIPHAPFGLYVKGNKEAIDSQSLALAIIGTRHATPEGKELAKNFAHKLASHGCTIISGLAFGIDAVAHQGCLDGGGITVAVFARGLDEIYPQSNARLAEKIFEQGGALVSEYPIGEPPLPYRFIERNRIISGLSQGVVVIEAPDGSGSLATARFALEQNRDVFVLPGNVSHANFKGSHELIRQGAVLVTSPEDILESYGMENAAPKKKKHIPASTEETLIMMVLEGSSTPCDVDKIIQMTRLEPRIVNRTITFLLMKDFIKEMPGGYTI